MKTFKNLLMVGVLCSGLLHGAWSSAAVVTLTSSSAVQAGSAFTVDVWVDQLFAGLSGDAALLAFGMTVVNSSPDLFTFTGASIAAPFDDDSALVGLHAAGSTFPGISNQPANQSLMLVTLSFFAIGAGDGTLGIRSDLSDPNQGLIFFQNAPVSLNADLAISVTTVPLPAALPLMLGAISLLAGIVRRRTTVA